MSDRLKMERERGGATNTVLVVDTLNSDGTDLHYGQRQCNATEMDSQIWLITISEHIEIIDPMLDKANWTELELGVNGAILSHYLQ